ncbi:MAG: PIN domain-containing protein [Archaeoglobi archaeon]|nr:PIN domain-containing protein [Candidatus Mnemosynella bozhongmuii]
MGLTIDTSVLIDFFIKRDSQRRRKSEEFLKLIGGKPIYCPKLILAETAGVLVRYSN